MKKIPLLQKICRSAAVLLCMAASVYFVLCAYILYAGRVRTPAPADAAVVLGAAAWGGRPSPVFVERIRYAAELYRTGTVGKIILTGGTPEEGYPTEAEVAAKYAQSLGIAADHLIIENLSRNTWENLKNTRDLTQTQDLHSFLIVSDPYHMARSVQMARDLGLEAQAAPTPTSRFNHAAWQVKLRFLHNECLNFGGYLLWRLFFRAGTP